MTEPITPRQFHTSDGVDDWRVVAGGAGAYFRTISFAATTRLMQEISDLDGIEDHHPVIDVRPGGMHVYLRTVTPEHYGLSSRDLDLARRISAVASEQNASADPAVVQGLVFSIDAMVIADVLPFWRAVLDYPPRADTPDEELNDRYSRGPIVFFNQMDAPRPQRNRVHVDVFVPHDQAEVRVKAALAAGGRLVTDKYAPSWWVLADAEGNEACVATWMGDDGLGYP